MRAYLGFLACLLALVVPSAAFAQDDSQTRVAAILEDLKALSVKANDAQTAKSIE